ncbi:response regulator transcription factor [Cohnella sp. JJ-181]|uniref:response regulator transcription factor n=1 Tax=Cohnella rhizoplanae TaxID=2974897 RepID=UPI0022FF5C1D|nr:response regulator transcription factor [Cohnella sp. JJ-181]CAI6021076.1 Response regulator protein GraR [Cohnella sp. JJ-181]
MYRIMIVEDDEKIGALLQDYIGRYGFDARVARDFRDLAAEFEALQPHLVLLDINLPYFDGYYWCRQIRKRSNVPIIFLSARSGEMDQVMAIENGGDDYVAKPIPLDLLMAKIKSALRRAYGEYAAGQAQSESDTAAAGGLALHVGRSELAWGGARVPLSKNERQLAHALIRRYGRIVSREELLEALWDDVQFVDDNTLTVNVTRLRKKLEELGLKDAIDTVRGQGYRLNADAGAGNGPAAL